MSLCSNFLFSHFHTLSALFTSSRTEVPSLYPITSFQCPWHTFNFLPWLCGSTPDTYPTVQSLYHSFSISCFLHFSLLTFPYIFSRFFTTVYCSFLLFELPSFFLFSLLLDISPFKSLFNSHTFLFMFPRFSLFTDFILNWSLK